MNPSTPGGLVVKVGTSTAFGGLSIICSASLTFGTRLWQVTTTAVPVSSSRVANEELAVPLATAT
eukprot:2294114-Prymnesium_polylepis.1